ncbi:hypothetical protein B0T24DRAFT_300321 [Lasiosphaeria ovina]|uniref:Azaphilone pigments biosynthesis cluster protein L N-terminal domain-containing protein n=1 Tax=Lasiosphaeria ovina TaxID=92902 RepID=A0AAE0K649_9PEZI|nr:hypothetical protein B0T24DRAFT_300321 [Lasiosphaeria ovina]
MDPISISASCLGLVATITKVSIFIASFVKDARQTRRELAGVSRELTSLKTILELLVEYDETPTVVLPESMTKHFSKIVTNCDVVVLDIEKCLAKYKRDSLLRSISWVASGQNDVAKLLRELESHKSALDLGLNMVELHLEKATHVNNRTLLGDTSILKADTASILQQIETLMARLPGNAPGSNSANSSASSNIILHRYLEELRDSYTEMELQSVASERDFQVEAPESPETHDDRGSLAEGQPPSTNVTQPQGATSPQDIAEPQDAAPPQDPKTPQKPFVSECYEPIGSAASDSKQLGDEDYMGGDASKRTVALFTPRQWRERVEPEYSRPDVLVHTLWPPFHRISEATYPGSAAERTSLSIDRLVGSLMEHARKAQDSRNGFHLYFLFIQPFSASAEYDIMRAPSWSKDWPEGEFKDWPRDTLRMSQIRRRFPGIVDILFATAAVQPLQYGTVSYAEILDLWTTSFQPKHVIELGFGSEIVIQDIDAAWRMEAAGFAVRPGPKGDEADKMHDYSAFLLEPELETGQEGEDAADEPQRGRSFACPFYKLNPHKYADCCWKKLNTISRVMQHIKRCHAIPAETRGYFHYCARCFTQFREGEESIWIKHSAACVAVEPAPDDLFNDELEELHRLFEANSRLPPPRRWYELWDQAFAGFGHDRPSSPYVENGVGEVSRLILSEGEARLAAQMDSVLQSHGVLPALAPMFLDFAQDIIGIISTPPSAVAARRALPRQHSPPTAFSESPECSELLHDPGLDLQEGNPAAGTGDHIDSIAEASEPSSPP